MTYVTFDYLILNDLHKSKLHNPLAEDKIEVQDKDLFSYLYSDWLQSDGFCGLLLYMCIRNFICIY